MINTIWRWIGYVAIILIQLKILIWFIFLDIEPTNFEIYVAIMLYLNFLVPTQIALKSVINQKLK